jgi:hypothetical protein
VSVEADLGGDCIIRHESLHLLLGIENVTRMPHVFFLGTTKVRGDETANWDTIGTLAGLSSDADSMPWHSTKLQYSNWTKVGNTSACSRFRPSRQSLCSSDLFNFYVQFRTSVYNSSSCLA